MNCNNDDIFISVLREEDNCLSEAVLNILNDVKVKSSQNNYLKTKFYLMNLNSRIIITPKMIKNIIRTIS